MGDWHCDIPDWDKITKETAAIILAQSEAYLKETIESAKLISAKADRLFGILLPIASGLVVFIINDFSNKRVGGLTISAVLSFLLIAVSLFYSFLNVLNYKIGVVGNYPRELFKIELINDKITKDDQYILMFIYVCESIQAKLVRNNESNTIRAERNKKALIALIGIPFTPLIAYPLFYLFQNCHCVSP